MLRMGGARSAQRPRSARAPHPSRPLRQAAPLTEVHLDVEMAALLPGTVLVLRIQGGRQRREVAHLPTWQGWRLERTVRHASQPGASPGDHAMSRLHAAPCNKKSATPGKVRRWITGGLKFHATHHNVGMGGQGRNGADLAQAALTLQLGAEAAPRALDRKHLAAGAVPHAEDLRERQGWRAGGCRAACAGGRRAGGGWANSCRRQQLPWAALPLQLPHLAQACLAHQLPGALKVLVVLEERGVQGGLGAVHVRHHQHLREGRNGEGRSRDAWL